MTVMPGQKGTAGIEEVPDPGRQDGALLVRGMAVGICGTDREIAEGAYGTPPSGEARLVIGHESLGEVLEAPARSGFASGDLVVGIVRLHGYGSEHWRVEPDFAVPILPRLGELGVLLACLLGAQRGYEMHVVDLAQAGPKRDLVEDLGARYHSGVGTVNACRRHWEQAAEALATADPGWLGGLITRRVPLTSWTEALDRQPEDIKVVVDLAV